MIELKRLITITKVFYSFSFLLVPSGLGRVFPGLLVHPLAREGYIS